MIFPVPSMGSFSGSTSSLTGTYSAGTTMYFNIGGNLVEFKI
jgi:hypothetical protein